MLAKMIRNIQTEEEKKIKGALIKNGSVYEYIIIPEEDIIDVKKAYELLDAKYIERIKTEDEEYEIFTDGEGALKGKSFNLSMYLFAQVLTYGDVLVLKKGELV